MNGEALKLTTYFGERDRSGGRLLGDVLLGSFARQQVQTSILLRGVDGFGLRRRPHIDRLLTLSEDLPAVAVAVDSHERIGVLLDEISRSERHGLITLERARTPADPVSAVAAEAATAATKLTVYVGRQQRVGRVPAFVAICELLQRRGLAGATVLLGVDGTVRGRRTRARFFARNAEVPMMVIAIGAGEMVAAVLPELATLLAQPQLTLERVQVCKRDGALLARPRALAGRDEHGLALWQKLIVYGSEDAQHEGRPLHRVLVERLRAAGAAGATTLRGVWGFEGHRRPHGDRLLQLRRHVPLMTIVIDAPAQIMRAFEIVDELTAARGLVTSEIVPALEAVGQHGRHGGLRLARPR